MLRAKPSQLSFYGSHIYHRVIPETHFLKLLDKAVDFSFVNQLCRDAYTPDFGRPAYEPETMNDVQDSLYSGKSRLIHTLHATTARHCWRLLLFRDIGNQ